MSLRFADLAEAAQAAGFEASALAPDPGEVPETLLPKARAVVLLASAGRATWAAFQASPEAADGDPHPMDRWSRRRAAALARRFGGAAALPFDGPPYIPFLRWAARAEPVWPSRLGMTLHARKGLWASWRAAIALPEPLPDAPEPASGPRPCDACPAPCLAACPVSAFVETHEGSRYDADRCAAHVRSAAGAPCREAGCLARRACPVGADYAHAPDQGAFHLAAFVRARP
ncbi:MAG: ferredoxin [Pseudomonadota bacterium]